VSLRDAAYALGLSRLDEAFALEIALHEHVPTETTLPKSQITGPRPRKPGVHRRRHPSDTSQGHCACSIVRARRQIYVHAAGASLFLMNRCRRRLTAAR
jgi:hypothetical protein